MSNKDHLKMTASSILRSNCVSPICEWNGFQLYPGQSPSWSFGALKTSTDFTYSHLAPITSWPESHRQLSFASRAQVLAVAWAPRAKFRAWARDALSAGRGKGYFCRLWWSLDSASSPECWRCLTWAGAPCRCRQSPLSPSQRPYWCSVQTGRKSQWLSKQPPNL